MTSRHSLDSLTRGRRDVSTVDCCSIVANRAFVQLIAVDCCDVVRGFIEAFVAQRNDHACAERRSRILCSACPGRPMRKPVRKLAGVLPGASNAQTVPRFRYQDGTMDARRGELEQ